MIFPEVKKLYKYTPINEKSLGILIKDEFWFSKPSNFNDPLDCGIQLQNQLDKESLMISLSQDNADISSRLENSKNTSFEKDLVAAKAYNEKILELVEKLDKDSFPEEILKAVGEIFTKQYYSRIQKIGILSLSEINDSMLMWSHYADQHKGICIEIERKKDNILANNIYTLPVRYSIRQPLFTLHEEGVAEDKEKEEIKRSLIYTKSVDWSYEREWRVRKEIGNKTYPIDAKITSIIFGLKTPPSSIQTIVALIDKINPEIQLKQTRIKHEEFRIEVIDFDKSLFIENLPTSITRNYKNINNPRKKKTSTIKEI